ncbi:hypothetical protein V5T82_15260 [Magnetovibrio sp. PR-2]|uniref:hypothetical protein n=1 Tax=Magnetovibrio sp. PR-2 TaxID=3120356 RepID=UPI002FCE4293
MSPQKISLYVKATYTAQMTGVDTKTVVSWIRRGDLRGKKMGDVWQVWREDHIRLIDPNDTFGARNTTQNKNLDAVRAKQHLEQLLSEVA